MDKRLKFNEPWILQRADPYVYEKDGWYYFQLECVLKMPE